MILKYVTNMESANLEYTFDKSEEDIKSFLEGVEAAKKCTREDIDKLCGLIVKHELVREHVPTELLASKEIWEQLTVVLAVHDNLPLFPCPVLYCFRAASSEKG
jgi:60 kDa SS-A/Ro ribonucleoprotein